MVEKFVSHTFYLMQIVRVSLFFIQKPPILSHFRNAAAWPYEMKYIKSYCYFSIYWPEVMFSSSHFARSKSLSPVHS